MILDNHHTIAWDFDKTLVDCPTALAAQRYIRDNPNKKHHIVTFRSHGMEDHIFDELSKYSIGLHQTDFDGVHNIEDEAHMAWELAMWKRSLNPDMAITSAEKYYLSWKGYICRRIGASVLVDDDTKAVSDGCKRFGILHFDPQELF